MTSERLWQRFGADLTAFVRRRVAPDDAEDVVQDIFVRIHDKLPQLEDETRVAGWVHRIARNAIADHHRRARPTQALLEEPAAEPAPEDAAAEKEVAGWLRGFIEELPEAQRDALERTELGGLSQKALAEELGLSPSGARTRVQRARTALKDKLLRCCHVELDRRGTVIDYRSRRSDCC